MFENRLKKSHSTLRAKRATFTFWMNKSLLKMPKIVNFGDFWKPEACGQTVLPGMSLLIAQKPRVSGIGENRVNNPIWPQASGFEKLAKIDYFWHFYSTFVHSKCKRSSQWRMRLFLWLSNTVFMWWMMVQIHHKNEEKTNLRGKYLLFFWL